MDGWREEREEGKIEKDIYIESNRKTWCDMKYLYVMGSQDHKSNLGHGGNQHYVCAAIEPVTVLINRENVIENRRQ